MVGFLSDIMYMLGYRTAEFSWQFAVRLGTIDRFSCISWSFRKTEF